MLVEENKQQLGNPPFAIRPQRMGHLIGAMCHPVLIRGSTSLFLHGLPEAEVGAGGVGDDAEPAHLRDFGFVSHDLCAKA
jgi:hypothetical protein